MFNASDGSLHPFQVMYQCAIIRLKSSRPSSVMDMQRRFTTSRGQSEQLFSTPETKVRLVNVLTYRTLTNKPCTRSRIKFWCVEISHLNYAGGDAQSTFSSLFFDVISDKLTFSSTGVQFAWIAISLITIPTFQYIKRRGEEKEWHKQQNKEKV